MNAVEIVFISLIALLGMDLGRRLTHLSNGTGDKRDRDVFWLIWDVAVIVIYMILLAKGAMR